MEKRRKLFRRLLILLGMGIGLCAVVTFACLIAFYNGFSAALTCGAGCLYSQPASSEMIERRGNLLLPASAENVAACSVAWQDCVVFISFDMAPEDLDAFLASTLVSTLAPTRGDQLHRFTHTTDDGVDWHFEDDQIYQYGEANEQLESQYIVVDTADSERYTVYIISVLL